MASLWYYESRRLIDILMRPLIEAFFTGVEISNRRAMQVVVVLACCVVAVVYGGCQAAEKPEAKDLAQVVGPKPSLNLAKVNKSETDAPAHGVKASTQPAGCPAWANCGAQLGFLSLFGVSSFLVVGWLTAWNPIREAMPLASDAKNENEVPVWWFL